MLEPRQLASSHQHLRLQQPSRNRRSRDGAMLEANYGASAVEDLLGSNSQIGDGEIEISCGDAAIDSNDLASDVARSL